MYNGGLDRIEFLFFDEKIDEQMAKSRQSLEPVHLFCD